MQHAHKLQINNAYKTSCTKNQTSSQKLHKCHVFYLIDI